MDKLVDKLIPADFPFVPKECKQTEYEEKPGVVSRIYRDALAEITTIRSVLR